MAIVYRIGNGSALTYTEVDGNFRYLLANMSGSIVAITGSTQITGSLSVLPEGTVNKLTSSWAISASVVTSASYAANATSASYAANATVSNVVFTNLGDTSTQTVEGNVRLTGDLIAEQYIVSSSVVHYTESFASGSHIFGDDSLDTHQFTGSVLITGSVDIVGPMAQGSGATATGVSAFSQGTNTSATNTDSHAEGEGSTASGLYSHAEGFRTLASHSATHAEGNYTTASAFGAHAEGDHTHASTGYAHAEGSYTKAQYSAHSEGYFTTASGNYSHAEGSGSVVAVSGRAAHAEGVLTLASNTGSHAEGLSTIASGKYSHAQGNKTIAVEIGSFSSGRETKAIKPYSFTHGYQVTSSQDYQTVIGQFNDTGSFTFSSTEKNVAMFVVGGGTGLNDGDDIINCFEAGFNNNDASVHYPWIRVPAYASDAGRITTDNITNPRIGQMFVSASEGGLGTSATTLVIYLGASRGWVNVTP